MGPTLSKLSKSKQEVLLSCLCTFLHHILKLSRLEVVIDKRFSTEQCSEVYKVNNKTILYFDAFTVATSCVFDDTVGYTCFANVYVPKLRCST